MYDWVIRLHQNKHLYTANHVWLALWYLLGLPLHPEHDLVRLYARVSEVQFRSEALWLVTVISSPTCYLGSITSIAYEHKEYLVSIYHVTPITTGECVWR